MQPDHRGCCIPHPCGENYSEGVPVEIEGQDFAPGAVARMNGKAIPTTYLSPTRLRVALPFTPMLNLLDLDPEKRVDGCFIVKVRITVRNPGRPRRTSAAKIFRLEAQPVG